MIALLLAAALTAQASKPATNLICPVLGNPTDAKSETVTVKGSMPAVSKPRSATDMRTRSATPWAWR